MTQVRDFTKQLQEENITTRKMLERVPTDKFGWKPHPKSMTMRELAAHIAELPGWVTMAITTDGLDFAANPYQVPAVTNTEELLAFYDRTYADGMEHLAKVTDADLTPEWVLRHGDQILNKDDKAGTIRIAISQTIHHRAQLGVYLRLLDIPIPGSYGSSADEQWG